MRLPITITYNAGNEVTVIAQPPEWAKWEKETGHSTTKFNEVAGIWDLLFLAFHTIKREAAGMPTKSFEAWMEQVADITVGESVPKVMNPEASAD